MTVSDKPTAVSDSQLPRELELFFSEIRLTAPTLLIQKRILAERLKSSRWNAINPSFQGTLHAFCTHGSEFKVQGFGFEVWGGGFEI